MLRTAWLADYLSCIDTDGDPQYEETQRFVHDYWSVAGRVAYAPLEYDYA
jgi:hypothetical protein